jgi:hypothetical protein
VALPQYAAYARKGTNDPTRSPTDGHENMQGQVLNFWASSNGTSKDCAHQTPNDTGDEGGNKDFFHISALCVGRIY